MNITAKQVSPQDMARMAASYYRFLGVFANHMEETRDWQANASVKVTPKVWMWDSFIQNGVVLAQAVLGTKEIPPGQEKNLELTIRLFMSNKRQVRDPVGWFDKNYKWLNFLYNAATKWPDKTDGSTQKFALGPFIVHNAIGLAGKDLEGIKDTITKAVMLIKGLKVPGIEKVLYGDVMVVPKLSGGTVIAWYYLNEDVVYIRPFANAGFDELHSFIHELGHRYIDKFMDSATWLEWRRYHASMDYKTPSGGVKLPEVGEPMPFEIAGFKRPPTVKKIEGLRYYVTDTKFMEYTKIKAIMEREAVFPTLYATKSEAEHFCEALAHRALGKLKEPNLSSFKAVVEEGKHGGDVAKLASTMKPNHLRVTARYMRSKSWFGLNIPDSPIVEHAKDVLNSLHSWLGLAVIPGHPTINPGVSKLIKYAEDGLPNYYGIYGDYTIIKPMNTAQEALRETEKSVTNFTKQSPLHQAHVVLMIYWKDVDMWSGVINHHEIRG